MADSIKVKKIKKEAEVLDELEEETKTFHCFLYIRTSVRV
jgi:hypothetical protein